MTTTTLALHVRALAFPREATLLSPVAQMIADDAGGLARGFSGLYGLRDAGERLLRLHGAVAPDEVILMGRKDAAEGLAMSRMMTGIPHTSVHASLRLPEWDAEDLANGVRHTFDTTGRVPDRLVVVLNESADFEERFMDRARWLLDVRDIIVRRVDPEIGLLERDVLAVAPSADDPQALLAILDGHEGDGPL